MPLSKVTKKAALDYHRYPRPGKMETVPTKPYSTPADLSLAYSPGVAYPCRAIAENPADARLYTGRANLVGVVSNGTAVLGLGDIGALASKPVMEGKALLMKVFAGINAFDIELDEKNPEQLIRTVKALAPTFGAINLEDIKAPECFEVEQRLCDELDIPVMHDDQHGTAIVSGAALLNALRLQNKRAEDVRVVINGAGAAAMSCAQMYVDLGVRKENIVMVDSRGVINKSRRDIDSRKKQWATSRQVNTLPEAMVDADVLLGLSVAGVVTAKMLSTMAPRPIVFALANPDPEIAYDAAIAARPDCIMATGRSDYPNQVNNVLAFPYLFRGALDSGATAINRQMMLAAVKAIAALAQQPITDEVKQIYHEPGLSFGPDYILPKPFDRRLLVEVAPAVAEAAARSGVATAPVKDRKEYIRHLSDFRLNLEEAMECLTM